MLLQYFYDKESFMFGAQALGATFNQCFQVQLSTTGVSILISVLDLYI